ncbi:hypothetical protein PIROE2DRAFT_10061, partial [Piromyces sp. E2]
MKFFKLITLFAITVVQGARVLNFTKYDAEWVKGKEYNIQYTYLEEPSFSNFQIRLYNSTDSISLKKVSTSDYSDKDIHSITLSYPEATTGKYKIVGLSDHGSEVSNNFSVRLVLKATPTESTSPAPSTTASTNATQTNDTNSNNKTTNENDKNKNENNVWKIVAIIVSAVVVLLILAILGFIIYNRYKKNKQYEEEANNSIWKVPISEKSIIANRGVNAYSVPNASVTERDLSFSSDLDGFYSYSSQVRNPDYFSSAGYKERMENTKSVYSISTNVTKASNNILDILYPSNEKKEKEKSLHEKSEISIELGHSHSQKSMGKRKKHTNSPSSGGQLRSPRSKSTERGRPYSEVRVRSNSFKANAMAARKSRISVAECENAILHKKSRVSLAESEKNAHILNQLTENDGDISLNNINNNSSVGANKNEAALNPDTPEYYIKHTKLNKKYIAVCNFKPKLIDEMNVTKNDVIVIHEVFT